MPYDPADRVESSHGVPKMEQETADDDDVEGSKVFRAQVVDTAAAPLDLRVENLSQNRKPAMAERILRLAQIDGLVVPDLRWIIERTEVWKVDGYDLGSALALHVECVEAVTCPDVEAALAA